MHFLYPLKKYLLMREDSLYLVQCLKARRRAVHVCNECRGENCALQISRLRFHTAAVNWHYILVQAAYLPIKVGGGTRLSLKLLLSLTFYDLRICSDLRIFI